MKRRSFLKLLGVTLAAPVGDALAQPASRRPVRILVPLQAGSSNDLVARVLAAELSKTLGQAFIVDNRPGGNGLIGTMEVVRSAPDGQILLLGSNSPLGVNVALVKNLSYDPRRDLTPIAGASLTNHVLMVRSTSPVRTLSEFIAYAKQRPGRVSIGYSTTSVVVQIATLNKLADIELLAVPYKGSPATITDVIGGALDATLTDPGNALSQANGGYLRALAVTSLKRNPVTPDWPAISETLSGFDFPSWNALVGPAGMPPELVQRLNAAVNQALKQKDLVERLGVHGATPLIFSPEELAVFIDSETAKWVRLAREANIEPE
jgi:tripartite-type tricarboxylate transporter receptor subunit TctC